MDSPYPYNCGHSTEDSDYYNEDSVMYPIIHLEDSDEEEDDHGDSPRKLLSSDPTWETVHQSEKSTEEPT